MATSRSDAGAPDDTSLHKDGRPFDRVLIANRGEIAVRIIQACRELGIETVAVYSDADTAAMHVRLADVAVRLGTATPAESYLRIDAIVEAAIATGAQAIHPGYGFLAERAAFARAVAEAGLTFVGPSASVIEALGDKLGARRLARDVGVDTVPGTLDAVPADRPDAVAAIIEEAESIGFPLLVKAAAGGGGRGMRRVERAADLPAALATASAEALSGFGDGTIYLEREIRPARHVEVQLLGDADGTVVAIGERDCSIQRRHQKLVEEAPAPGLSRAARVALHERAVRIGAAAGLLNAATAEFLLEPGGAVWFLEVNTRLQVEHGITELVSGLDIVREQLWLAAGRRLSDDAQAAAARAADPTRHAIEVRLTAEDPSRQFAPTPGTIRHWTMPEGPGIRVDSAGEVGARVPPEYDNLVAKLMVVADDRPAAIDRLQAALEVTEVAGIQTTLPFHRFVARAPAFRDAALSIDWVDANWDGEGDRRRVAARATEAAARAAIGAAARSLRTGAARPTPEGWRSTARAEAIDRWPR
jgi:acetyl/propionyl-CoA carboxylase alpha subunit